MLINITRDSLDATAFGDTQPRFIRTEPRYQLTIEQDELVIVSADDWSKFGLDIVWDPQAILSYDLPAGQVLVVKGDDSKIVFLPVL